MVEGAGHALPQALAGQHADYIVKQLTEFKSGARKNPIMMGMAAPLSPEDMKNVGAYFAEQKIKPREAADKKLLPEGQKIFKGGVASTKIPACMACHGPAGRGNPGAAYPAIGGQHADYTKAKLTAFRDGLVLGTDDDANPVMATVAANLSDDDIEALASYIEGLHHVTPGETAAAGAAGAMAPTAQPAVAPATVEPAATPSG